MLGRQVCLVVCILALNQLKEEQYIFSGQKYTLLYIYIYISIWLFLNSRTKNLSTDYSFPYLFIVLHSTKQLFLILKGKTFVMIFEIITHMLAIFLEVIILNIFYVEKQQAICTSQQLYNILGENEHILFGFVYLFLCGVQQETLEYITQIFQCKSLNALEEHYKRYSQQF